MKPENAPLPEEVLPEEVLPPTPQDQLPSLKVDVTTVAENRLIPIALQTLEEEMLNAKDAKDRISAANSTLDRFGYPVSKTLKAAVAQIPITPDALKELMHGLKNAFHLEQPAERPKLAPLHGERLPEESAE